MKLNTKTGRYRWVPIVYKYQPIEQTTGRSIQFIGRKKMVVMLVCNGNKNNSSTSTQYQQQQQATKKSSVTGMALFNRKKDLDMAFDLKGIPINQCWSIVNLEQFNWTNEPFYVQFFFFFFFMIVFSSFPRYPLGMFYVCVRASIFFVFFFLLLLFCHLYGAHRCLVSTFLFIIIIIWILFLVFLSISSECYMSLSYVNHFIFGVYVVVCVRVHMYYTYILLCK